MIIISYKFILFYKNLINWISKKKFKPNIQLNILSQIFVYIMLTIKAFDKSKYAIDL